MKRAVATVRYGNELYINVNDFIEKLTMLKDERRMRPLTLEEAQKRFNQSTKGIDLIYTSTGMKHKLVFISNTGTMLLRRLEGGNEWRCDYKKLFTDFTFTDGANIGEYDEWSD